MKTIFTITNNFFDNKKADEIKETNIPLIPIPGTIKELILLIEEGPPGKEKTKVPSVWSLN